MRIWAIVAAVILGVVSRSIFGFILGFFLGSYLYYLFNKVAPVKEEANEETGTSNGDNTLLFDVLYEMMGAIYKAKGRVTQEDIRYATKKMDQMQLFGDDRLRAQAAFNKGKQLNYAQDVRLDLLYQTYRRYPKRLEFFCEQMIQAALYDGTVTELQLQMIINATSALHLSRPRVLEYIQAILDDHHARQSRSRSSYQQRRSSYEQYQRQTQSASPEQELAAAYKTLGVQASDEVPVIKRAYRKLMNEYHPDKLVSKGLSESQLEAAKKKAQTIQLAYDTIKAARQFK